MNITTKGMFIAAALAVIGCGTLQNVEDIAQLSREVVPLVETGKDVAAEIKNADDWAGIIEKIAYGVGAAAAVAGGVIVQKKRNKRI